MDASRSHTGDQGDAARQDGLTIEHVRRVARLSRLELSEPQLEDYRRHLGAVIAHVRTLSDLDLTGVEPLAHPIDAANRWDEDIPGPELPNSALMSMAPDKAEPFIKVPKVLGDGGSA